MDDEKHVQYITRNILAPYNVIFYATCDVLVVYTVDEGLFHLWSCTNMKLRTLSGACKIYVLHEE